MKKVFGAFLMVCLLSFGVFMTACGGDAKFESMSVKENTNTTFVQGESVNLNNITIVIKYEDDKEKEIKASDPSITIDGIDTNVVGKQTWVITYDDGKEKHTIELDVNIVSADEIKYIFSVETPMFVNSFQENKNDFSDKTGNVYYVGDENAFVFKPMVTAILMNNQIMPLESYKSVSVVEIKQDGEFVELSEEEQANYVSVNNDTQEFDFTDYAIGKTFRISVTAEGYISDEPAPSIEIEIVDGWNVYSAVDLFAFDTREDSSAIREEYGISNEVSGLVLHNNIKITKEDTLSSLYYSDEEWKQIAGASNENYQKLVQAGIDGTLKDRVSIFERTLDKNEKFTFYGNYNTIDSSELPLVTVNGDNAFAPGTINSHSQLFFAVGTANVLAEEGYKNNTSFTMKNIAFIGNASKAGAVEGEDKVLTEVKSGGLMMLKIGNTYTTLDNVNVKSHYISYMTQKDNGSYEVNKANNYTLLNHVVAQDSFSSNLYSWGGGQLDIKNSVIKDSGGPAIIADHVYDEVHETVEDGCPTFINIENSTVESLVNGSETWFKQLNVTQQIQMFAAMDQMFTKQSGQTKSIIAKNEGGFNYLNLQCVFKHSSVEGLTAIDIQGTLTIDGVKVIDMQGADPDYAMVSKSTAAPLFAVPDNNGEFSYAYGIYSEKNPAMSGLFDCVSSNIMTGQLIPVAQDSKFFSQEAEEIGVFFPPTADVKGGFMGIVLGYYTK